MPHFPCSAYPRLRHINVGRRPGDESPPLMFPGAVAIIDADTGLVMRLTYYISTRPVERYELRDVKPTDVGDFQVELPADRPTVEELPSQA